MHSCIMPATAIICCFFTVCVMMMYLSINQWAIHRYNDTWVRFKSLRYLRFRVLILCDEFPPWCRVRQNRELQNQFGRLTHHLRKDYLGYWWCFQTLFGKQYIHLRVWITGLLNIMKLLSTWERIWWDFSQGHRQSNQQNCYEFRTSINLSDQIKGGV